MPQYRFLLVAESGHIHAPPISIEATSDVDALRRARELIGLNDIEVWQGTRLVAYLTPTPHPANPEPDAAPPELPS